jgi:hypothetical protein
MTYTCGSNKDEPQLPLSTLAQCPTQQTCDNNKGLTPFNDKRTQNPGCSLGEKAQKKEKK